MEDSHVTVAASDDKACTFVGTAAYVPPEVLNSSPATFGHDPWALGCTLYQMLSGTPPFNDASEWLIFQRIIARDLRFPNYFSDEAKNLIDRLLDKDPIRRPGAGPDGYDTLKNHPFFNGINWKRLRSQVPSKLALGPKAEMGNSLNYRSSSLRQPDGTGSSSASAGHVRASTARGER
ncbi:unnamed protein product [Rhodiola kirilowii]